MRRGGSKQPASSSSAFGNVRPEEGEGNAGSSRRYINDEDAMGGVRDPFDPIVRTLEADYKRFDGAICFKMNSAEYADEWVPFELYGFRQTQRYQTHLRKLVEIVMRRSKHQLANEADAVVLSMMRSDDWDFPEIKTPVDLLLLKFLSNQFIGFRTLCRCGFATPIGIERWHLLFPPSGEMRYFVVADNRKLKTHIEFMRKSDTLNDAAVTMSEMETYWDKGVPFLFHLPFAYGEFLWGPKKNIGGIDRVWRLKGPETREDDDKWNPRNFIPLGEEGAKFFRYFHENQEDEGAQIIAGELQLCHHFIPHFVKSHEIWWNHAAGLPRTGSDKYDDAVSNGGVVWNTGPYSFVNRKTKMRGVKLTGNASHVDIQVWSRILRISRNDDNVDDGNNGDNGHQSNFKECLYFEICGFAGGLDGSNPHGVLVQPFLS